MHLINVMYGNVCRPLFAINVYLCNAMLLPYSLFFMILLCIDMLDLS
jgi:hypothetical protein